MSHLAPDRLAALADEPATADEAVHLDGCPACRAEISAYAALLVLARREGTSDPDAAGAPAGPPLTSWEGIAAGLRREGLLASPAAPAFSPPAAAPTAPAAAPRRPRWWRQAAAAAVLVVGGTAIGRATATTPLPGLPPVTAGSETARGDAGVREASDASFASNAAFGSPQEAMDVLTRAQRDYQRAAAWLAAHDTTGMPREPEVLRTRLAALDEVMPHVRQALNAAPQDPVLNDYYLATYDARESTLRQLGRALPVGEKLNGY